MYRDLDALRDFGLDIAKLPTYPVSYALVSRTFTAAELMLLTDAVQSSRFLTVRMAHRLTEGLASLGSCHQAAALSKKRARGRPHQDAERIGVPPRGHLARGHPPPPAGGLPAT